MILIILIILLFIISIIMSIKTIKEEFTTSRGDKVALFIFSFIGSIFISVIVMLGALALIAIFTPKQTYTYKIPIVSLRNNDNIEGRFTLGCGSIDTVEYYYCYVKRSDGGFRRLKVETIDVVIYESDNEPHYTWKIKKVNKGFWSPFDFTVGTSYDKKLIVPKKTVVRKFQAW